MPKIAIIITNLALGGAERWVANTSRLLSEHGCRVHVILFEDKQEQDLDPRVRLSVLSPTKRISGSFLRRRKYAGKLRRLIHSSGPFDLIISTLPYSDHVTHMAKLNPVCFRIANTLSQEIQQLPFQKAKRRRKRYLSIYQNQRVVSVAEGVRSDLVEFFGLDPKTITTIYNPIDSDILQEKAREKALPVPEGPYLIHSGRFTRQKRHDILLEAWKIFREDPAYSFIEKLRLLCPDSPELQKLIADLNLQDSVEVLGAKGNPYPWVSNAHCLVLSSDREGMPNVLLEALALGVPVASTDCPSGPRELLGKRHPKALSRLNDPSSLVDAIKYSLKADWSNATDILAPFHPSLITTSIIQLCHS